ncbi:MAG: DUF6599 family protein [candidate division Zixibacteria bacterium]
MLKQYTVLGSIMLAVCLLHGCSTDTKSPEAIGSARFLPEQFADGSIVRSSEVRLFVGDSLWEYINGGAEVYHMYQFVDVATAYYKKDETEIVADIYRFEDADRAFGLYATLRPDEPQIVQLGVEGFTSTGSMSFVRGEYMIKLTGYDETEMTQAMIELMSGAMVNLIPGTTELPAMFALLPEGDVQVHSERLFAQSFMGRQYLSNVYSANYVQGDDSVSMFIMADENSASFDLWLADLAQGSSEIAPLVDFAFDNGKSFITEGYYGRYLAGCKGGYTIGIVNYNDQLSDLLRQWLEALEQK